MPNAKNGMKGTHTKKTNERFSAGFGLQKMRNKELEKKGQRKQLQKKRKKKNCVPIKGNYAKMSNYNEKITK